MALDDEYLDPEPVCIYGIDKEIAVDKLRDIGCMSRGRYWFYRLFLRKAVYFGAAEAGVLLTMNEPLDVGLGAVALIAAITAEYGIELENRNAAEWLKQEAGRQAKASVAGAPNLSARFSRRKLQI